MRPLKQWMKRAGIGTQAELARRIADKWNELDPRAKKPVPRSLESKLVTLENETQDGWWRERPLAAQATEEVLNLQPGDLGVDIENAAGNYACRELPRLRMRPVTELGRVEWRGAGRSDNWLS